VSRRTVRVDHEQFYQDVVALLKKHAGHLTGLELLAVVSNLVGKIIAMQDLSLTPDEAMETVLRNIQIGNEQAYLKLGKTEGSA